MHNVQMSAAIEARVRQRRNGQLHRFDRINPQRTAHVVIDMHASHLWDASTIAALDAITEKYHAHGTDVKIIGLNDASLLMQERLGGKLGAGH